MDNIIIPSGYRILNPSDRNTDHRRSFNPFNISDSKGKVYAKKVELCCNEIVRKSNVNATAIYMRVNEKVIKIDIITPIAVKYGVKPGKIDMILNGKI